LTMIEIGCLFGEGGTHKQCAAPFRFTEVNA
jgi:hypothetical protein